METIPARIVHTVTQKDEILAIQLTENLQREDLNPIDQAKGILTYIQAKHPDKGYNLDGVMSILVSYKRRPEDLPGGVAPTVGAIIEISAKSITTLYNTISLLKLVPKIQDVIFSGKLPGEWRKGTSPLRSLRTGLELLSSSGSHYPAVGRIPICQCGNKEGCLLATPPNQYIALV
ncbi:MAG: hypothetical protein NT010_12165 [Proteobacteria bacterium]|nr:hypothetical protein [Pseudomonadota bacterium]